MVVDQTYDMYWDMRKRDACDEIKHLKFLFQNYEPRYWYFDCLEMLRK